ncbi:MAG: hypothetical protein Q8936_04865 [Bacillota bacterium]|nr:hypothetical protein [Bacillota bacterium]
MNSNKIKAFESGLINAGRSNLDSFQFGKKTYPVKAFDNFVQTLIDERILFRISMDEKDNIGKINYDYLPLGDN